MKTGLAILLLTVYPSLALADTCTAIKFQRGKSGSVVSGTAYSDSMTCFTIETGAGQTATVKIVSSGGEDTAFNVADVTHSTYVVDNQAAYSFKTSAGVYQIDVYRTLAREPPVPFKMSVEVR